MWSTLSNNDIAHGVYGSSPLLRAGHQDPLQGQRHISFDFGIDNIGNYKYFLFHPFPQRTFISREIRVRDGHKEPAGHLLCVTEELRSPLQLVPDRRHQMVLSRLV